MVPAPRHTARGEHPPRQRPPSPSARPAVGRGTLSSSDGQRFPQRGRSLTARALSRYFLDEGTTTYTHSSDQHSTSAPNTSRPPGIRPSPYSIRSSATRPTWRSPSTPPTLPGNLAMFAIFNLAGLQFSPRIRDIGRLQLYRLGAGSAWRSRYRHAGPLLAPAHPTPADRRPLERPAPTHRLDEIRAHHREPAHRQTARQQSTELPRPRTAGIWPACCNHLPISYVESGRGAEIISPRQRPRTKEMGWASAR